MKIKSSNARIQTYDLRIWQAWVCEILIDWIYRIQKDSFVFDLWRNLFRERDDEAEVEGETEYLSSKKARCLWPCGACSSSLSLWNMWYKFFTDKHGLIDEPREELRDESLERVRAGEPRGEGIEDEGIDEPRGGVRAGDLGGETEAFRVGVRRESRAGE